VRWRHPCLALLELCASRADPIHLLIGRLVARISEAGSGGGGPAPGGPLLQRRGAAQQVVAGLLKKEVHECGAEMTRVESSDVQSH
jgi:hypothetical protein